MIKITNGKETLLVTSGAFKSQYKPFGWEKVEAEAKPVEIESVIVGNDDEVPTIESLKIEKPLSEMSAKELKAKAKELGVDISAATTKTEARKMLADIIR